MEPESDRRATADLSWDRGPANSRFVRLLSYATMGLSGGLVLGFVALFGPDFVSRLAGGTPLWLLAGLVVAVVAFGPILWASVRTSRVQRERNRLAREWFDVTRSVSSLVAVLLVGGLLVGAGRKFDWSLETYLAFSFAGVLVGQALAVLAGFLGSAGAIDAEELTLSYSERDDVDLRRLRDVKRLSLGRYTVLWLLVSKTEPSEKSGILGESGEIGESSRKGRTNAAGKSAKSGRTGGPGQGLYAIPTPVVERAWPVFERGMADGATEPGTGAEGGRLLRRINLAVSLVFVAGGIGVLAFLAWVGAPAWQSLQWLWVLSGVGFFFGRFLARTY